MRYTIREAANLVGVHVSRIRKAHKAGELPFVPGSRLYGEVLQVGRADLIAWLVRMGFPLDDFRYRLAAGDHVLTCGLGPDHLSALAGMRVECASSPTRLGRLLATKPAWAVILSLPRLGREQGMAVAAEIVRDPGRPYLIGLVGEDEATRPGRAADLFDVLFSDDISPPRLRASLDRLRKCGDRAATE
jgi:excisionase family DNA binding protein